MVCVFSLWVTIWATAHVSHIRHFDRLGYVSCTESCSEKKKKKKSKHLLWFDSSWHIWISQHTLVEESLSAAPDWKVTKSNIKLPGSEILHHQTIHMKKKKILVQSSVCVCVSHGLLVVLVVLALVLVSREAHSGLSLCFYTSMCLCETPEPRCWYANIFLEQMQLTLVG